ncbi:YpiB family protein [Sporolactobacillus sp. Y61]|uniref:YpiB family protein n=1 Tax=Sporolactobacillus sp. Y61 TaxID=3160863 RepID=A0AAU8IDH7_9BACL
MNQIVSVTQKKTFIKWLLDQKVVKNRETIWLLNYVAGHDQLLELIHFSDNLAGCNRTITISTDNPTGEIFTYVKHHVITHDPEKTFHDLRLNQEEAVFIRMECRSIHGLPEYIDVLEDTPGVHQSVHEKYGEAAEHVAGAAEKACAEKRLYKAINETLDQGDKEGFYHLTAKLQTLKKHKH